MASVAPTGWCNDCAQSGQPVVCITGVWLCAACLFKRAEGDRLEVTKCENCGESDAVTCYDCSSCDEEHERTCTECYNTAEVCEDHANRWCNVCGNAAEFAYCSDHDGIKCESCDTLIRADSSEKAYCEACYADAGETTTQIPFVIADDGNANIQGTEVRWS